MYPFELEHIFSYSASLNPEFEEMKNREKKFFEKKD